jgi:flagellar hook-associated protein 3 FlgL
MRVATNSYTDSMLNQFNVLTARQFALQQQSATGLKIQAASDDPVAMQNTLNGLANKAAQVQYSNNIATLQNRGTSIYNAIESLQKLSSRAGEIVTSAGSPTASSSQLNNYASEVKQLLQQAVQLMNTKDAATGQYLFGGTNSTRPPYATTTDASGNLTAVTYQGNASVNQTEIAAGTTLSVDVPGENTTGNGPRGLITDSSSGADLFNHLLSLQNNLSSGNTAAITATDGANLQKDEDNLLYQISNNGAVQTRLNIASTFATSQTASLNQNISNSSSADLVQTMVDLNQAQTAYQAALQSGTKLMQLSILNYIS